MTDRPADDAVALLSAQVGHYENFPVASLLCPPALRPAVMAIYHFARTADDMADEGPLAAEQRLQMLAAYRAALDSAAAGRPDVNAWPTVFVALAETIRSHAVPVELLHHLIDAFEQDVRHTANGHRYADHAELLAYCRLSANPVGRLMLHLYGIDEPRSLEQSDAVCSALQLINFWQDISVDLPRHRNYLPANDLARHGLELPDFLPGASPHLEAQRSALVAQLCLRARELMLQGAPLAGRIPGRAGWELRLVVQGGLLVLDKIKALGFASWRVRPTVGKADLPRLLWRAWRAPDFSARTSAG